MADPATPGSPPPTIMDPFFRRAGRAALAGALLLAALAGCASGEGAKPAASSISGTSGPASSTPQSTSSQPPGTVWADAPNPCSLLTDTEIREVTRFEVNTERRDSTGPDGGKLGNCLSQNRLAGVDGGYVAITVLPPGSPLLGDRSQVTAIEEVSGIGKSAYVAHSPKALGAGSNIGFVDMGNGGFLIGAQVFTDVTTDQMRGLLTAAAGRWPTR